MYSIMTSANSDSFTFSFLIGIPFISFSSLITVAKNSRTMLNNSGESGQSAFVLTDTSNIPGYFRFLLYQKASFVPLEFKTRNKKSKGVKNSTKQNSSSIPYKLGSFKNRGSGIRLLSAV